MIKRFLIAFVLLAAIAGGLVGFNRFRSQAIEQYFANAPAPSVVVTSMVTEAGTWTPSIKAIGTVNAARGVDLTVETTGIVKEVRFTANQRVSKGDVLVLLDDAVERADLDAGQIKADLDKQSLERSLELQQRGVGTTASLEAAQAAASTSSSQLAKLRAVLDQKQLIAPFSGTLGIPRVDEGQYIAPGATVATLQDLETMRADFTVPEQQLSLLEISQPVRLGLSGADMSFSGTISGIDPKVDPATRLVSVRAKIDNAGGNLTPGQFVQIQIELPVENGVVALPQTAVVTSLYGDYVYVVKPRTPAPAAPVPPASDTPASVPPAPVPPAPVPPAPVPPASGTPAAPQTKVDLEVRQVFVKTGRRSGDQVEIATGIAAGDRVVTVGQNRLSNGSPVTLQTDASQPAAADTAPAAATEASAR